MQGQSVTEAAKDSGKPSPTETGLSEICSELEAPIRQIIDCCERIVAEAKPPDSFLEDIGRIRQSGGNLIRMLAEKLVETHEEGRGEEEWRHLIHDLRTPVNHVVGYAEMLSEEAEEESLHSLKQEFDRIHETGRSWLSLLEKRLHRDFEKQLDAIPEQDEFLIEQIRQTVTDSPAVSKAAESGHILVIDDDPMNRDVLTKRLIQQGHSVETAPDGVSGFNLLNDKDFDLVLLDMLMPGMNGMEVLARIKGDERLQEIPVVVISALDDEAGIAKCIELGAEDYLSKPFYPAVLRARIGTSLEKRRLRETEKRHLAEIQEERRKSDRLLLNILPEPIAGRLKSGEQNIADHFSEVTVLFTDLVAFTELSARFSPAKVVGMLNQIFTAFDRSADRHGLEKIKTIGDAYMAVAGIPEEREDHAEAVAAFALDLMDDLDRLNRDFDSDLALRVGLASGPVIAGVVGIHKFIYDLWGDTVNTASRMESHGKSGRIHVSEPTWKRLQGKFPMTARGEIKVKGKGKMKTWFLDRDGKSES